MKTQLKKTTVRKQKKGFCVFKGKGTGSQIARFDSIEECIRFDSEFDKLEYRLIVQKSTNEKGGAYFYKNTDLFFDTKHPFFNDFKKA